MRDPVDESATIRIGADGTVYLGKLTSFSVEFLRSLRAAYKLLDEMDADEKETRHHARPR